MIPEEFVKGLLAALRLKGLEFIDTRRNIHHTRFNAVVGELARIRRIGKLNATEMPRAWVPSPFTGRYKSFEDALVRLQPSLLSAPNPLYPGVELSMSEGLAKRVLDRFTPDERVVFRKLADAYLRHSENPVEAEQPA